MYKKLMKRLSIIRMYFENELLRIVKDPGVLLICVGALIIYPIVYATIYKNNVLEDIPVAVVDLDNTPLSRKVANMVDATSGLDVAMKTGDFNEAKEHFWEKNVFGLIVIPGGFEKDVYNGEQATISTYSNGSYFLLNKQTLSSALQSVGTLSAGIEIKRLLASGLKEESAMARVSPLNTQYIGLYNPGNAYASYVMPGLILVIIQQTLLIGIGILGATQKEQKKFGVGGEVVHREKTLYALVFGKSLAYIFIYMFTSAFCLYWVHHWYGYPDKSTFMQVLLIMVPYLFASTFLGLTLSNLFTRREHAIIFLVFLSPVVLFISGISWPASLIPKPLYQIAHFLPSTKLIPAYLRIRTMGVGLEGIKNDLWFVLGQVVIYYFTAVFSFKMSLKRLARKQQKQQIQAS